MIRFNLTQLPFWHRQPGSSLVGLAFDHGRLEIAGPEAGRTHPPEMAWTGPGSGGGGGAGGCAAAGASAFFSAGGGGSSPAVSRAAGSASPTAARKAT